MSPMGVRRDKAALSSECKSHPAKRSSRKQPEQPVTERNDTPSRCAGVVVAACTQGKRTQHGKPHGAVRATTNWKPAGHRQTKEAATDMFSLQPPRHIPTLPLCRPALALCHE